MQLKQYVRFSVPTHSKTMRNCYALLGLSFFLRILYFFGTSRIGSFGAGQLIFQMILPLLVCGAFIVMLGVLHINNPGIYGILGAIALMLTGCGSFFSGDALRIVLSLLFHLPAAGLLLITVGGYFPIRAIFSGSVVVSCIIRVFLFDLGRLSLNQWILESSVILLLISMALFVNGLKPNPPQDTK